MAAQATPQVTVEVEEPLYEYEPGEQVCPLFLRGSSCLARIGETVYVSGVETWPQERGFCNTRWVLHRRGPGGWEVQAKSATRTMEPCPLVALEDGRLYLSDNPAIPQQPERYCTARPVVHLFDPPDSPQPTETLLPRWQGEPCFMDHSYRSFAGDGPGRELVLIQNVGMRRAEWAFFDRNRAWSAQGQIIWPRHEATGDPLRLCHPTVGLRDRALYFCGVADILETNPVFLDLYRQHGFARHWTWRRLLFSWSEDLTREGMHEWLELATVDRLGGYITPCDLWVGPEGVVHLLWHERLLDPMVREALFPEAQQRFSLQYAQVKHGELLVKRELVAGGEAGPPQMPGLGRFHISPDGRLFVFYYLGGEDDAGDPVSQNRVMELGPEGAPGPSVEVPLTRAFHNYYATTWRNGCAPAQVLDLYGETDSTPPNSLHYARVRIG